jgi:uncharacterized membrane protein YuzA (DUF378 family)
MSFLATEEAGFYAAVWLFAFLVSVFRSLSGDDTVSVRVCVGSSGVTGFFAFAVVSFLCGKSSSDDFSGQFYYLGLSALIGLAGPINQKAIHFLLKKFGLEIKDDEDDEKHRTENSSHSQE